MARSLCSKKSPRFKDETGNVYGRLTVLEEAVSSTHGAHWLCACECGNKTVACGSHLRQGRVESCGCRRLEHGHAIKGQRTVEYQAWCAMIARCECETHQCFDNYGGRGISVCERWRTSFENFLADMGERPTNNHSLDRYPNNDGNYEPGNCRWATFKQQMNNRQNTPMIEFRGETRSIREWTDLLGFSKNVIYSRLNELGWSIERALTEPVGSK